VRKEIYIEGGGDSKELRVRCREGFRDLLQKCGFSKRLPALVACGGRRATFEDFKTAHLSKRPGDYVAMWVDSEEPMADMEAAWNHLKRRDDWKRPKGAQDDQVLLMTTCMETWVIADRPTLRSHYKRLRENALPPLHNLENRHRHDVQDRLSKATRDCTNAYTKGKRSFEVLGKLTPDELGGHLPSFTRVRRILKKKL
jgi:hypothetical protein